MKNCTIFGLSGLHLTPDEKLFFQKTNPWGYILFKRNVESAEQVRALTQSIRDNVGWSAPIFVDQEGGRVARLGPPDFPTFPSAQELGSLPQKQAERAVYLGAHLIAHHLRHVGITANCMPVLDLLIDGANPIIGTRSYGKDPKRVATLGQCAIEGTLAGGVLPVIKHIPGHGRATLDSHLALPHVDASLDDLAQDFFPFEACANCAPAAMTAHIMYTQLDTIYPATLSPQIVHLIRTRLAFQGLLMTDDLSMAALSSFGDIGFLAHQAIEAGCDIVLHCNGNLDEMRAIADRTPTLNVHNPTWTARTQQCERIITQEVPFDYTAAWAEFKEL